MNAPNALLGLAAGLLVGAAYFAGLWWTVRKVTRVQRPAPWLLGSFVARSLLALAAFALVLRLASPFALLAALIGFMAARWLATRFLPSERQAVEGAP